MRWILTMVNITAEIKKLWKRKTEALEFCGGRESEPKIIMKSYAPVEIWASFRKGVVFSSKHKGWVWDHLDYVIKGQETGWHLGYPGKFQVPISKHNPIEKQRKQILLYSQGTTTDSITDFFCATCWAVKEHDPETQTYEN